MDSDQLLRAILAVLIALAVAVFLAVVIGLLTA